MGVVMVVLSHQLYSSSREHVGFVGWAFLQLSVFCGLGLDFLSIDI